MAKEGKQEDSAFADEQYHSIKKSPTAVGSYLRECI